MTQKQNIFKKKSIIVLKFKKINIFARYLNCILKSV